MRHICGCRMRTCWYLLVPIAFLFFYYVHHYRETTKQINQVYNDYGVSRYNGIVTWKDVTHSQISVNLGERNNTLTNRFILGINFWEQLTMATNNLLHLVCLGAAWNASTVQPFTSNSRLYGLRNFLAGEYEQE